MTRRMIQALGLAVLAAAVLAAVAVAAATPIVATGTATNRTDTGAKLNGTLNPEGAATKWYFQYGLTTAYPSGTSVKISDSGTRNESVSATISGLTPGTTYHYRLVATSAAGSAIGVDKTFTTTGHPPAQPVTGGVINLSRNGATLTGTINPEGQATTWEFQYGLTANYTATSVNGTVGAFLTPVTVLAPVSGLAAGTVFHYRLVAFHGSTVSYGADQTFLTFPYPRLHGRLRVSTLPTIAASKPYLFTTSGTLLPSSALPAGVACNGVVAVHYVVNHKLVAVRMATVAPNCTFSTQVLFHRLVRGKAARVRVDARFHGNNYLVPVSARSQRVRLGL